MNSTGNGGVKRIEFSRIPEKAFFDAIQKRIILKVRPLNSDEKKKSVRGGPDILALFPDGSRHRVTRKYVLDGFTYLNGGKIKMYKWTSEKWYTVMKQVEEPVKVTLIPRNYCVETYKGDTRGRYIVLDNNGGENEYLILSPAIFKKMFLILPDTRIINAKRSKGKRFKGMKAGGIGAGMGAGIKEHSMGAGMGAGIKAGGIVPNAMSGDMGSRLKDVADTSGSERDMGIGDTSGLESGAVVGSNVGSEMGASMGSSFGASIGKQIAGDIGEHIGSSIGASIGSNIGSNVGSKLGSSLGSKLEENMTVKDIQKKPGSQSYTVIARLLNPEDKLVGFVIEDDNKRTKRVSKSMLLDLCSEKLVTNVVAAEKEDTGKKYLRGNGMKISSLPSERV